MGAKLSRFYDSRYGWSKEVIFLPVLINGVLEGYIKAGLKKEKDRPSYINAKGPWSKSHGLFPYDYAVNLMNSLNSSTMFLVEGPRDALRLLALGIPAMSILGTQAWSELKIKVLSLAPIDQIVLMLDGDDAGIQATEKIEPTLQPYFQEVQVVKLWKYKQSPYQLFADCEFPSKAAKEAGVNLWDPCSCPIVIINKLKKIYFED